MTAPHEEHPSETPSGSLHAFDTPASAVVADVFRVSGWWISPEGSPAVRIDLLIDGRACSQAVRAVRMDVGANFPDNPEAALGGFYGDVVVPPEAYDRPFAIAADFTSASGRIERIALGDGFQAERASQAPSRSRSYDLQALWSPEALAVMSGDAPGWHATLRRTEHFHGPGEAPVLRLLEAGSTHAYPLQVEDLVEALPAGALFLDLGSGIRPDRNILPNGVYLDAIHFPRVDVVSTLPRLPFRDQTFDLVFSLAVFEHLIDPYGMALEIRRVLKPGGVVYIETAFMQPFHGDPDHYFNMTEPALRHVLRDFDIEWAGVAPHQSPSYGLIMQLEAVEAYAVPGKWKDRLARARDVLLGEGLELDAALGPIGRRILSAGVNALARRPPFA